MSSSSDIFQRVRSAVDIVEVIGEHVALKRAGREFKGLCPFHEDHRPSMAVVPHKQIFHCFVCGTGGDVFKFVKEFHKMGAGETLRMLAQRAGVKLPELAGIRRGGEKDKDGLTPRERIAATNEWACGFFEKFLRGPQGKAGLDYFHARGLTDDTIAKFRLGMSPDSWTGLVNAAMRPSSSASAGAAIPNDHLLEAGLIKQRQDSSPYDVFRNRVIFPIVDATGGARSGGGRVIAFGGRILEEKRDEAGNVVEAKYLNSPETRLFIKSESLYGLNHARQQIIRTRTAIVVEGYMDVIASHQAGVTNVIATLGTALTPEHARILKNYAQTIVLVFDSDDAGRRAADRAMEVFVRGSLEIKLASVPEGKDPCDFCIKNGEAGGALFQKLIENATDAMTYKWMQLQQQFHGTDSLTARQEAATAFLRFAAAAMESQGDHAAPAIDPIRRGLLLSKIAGLISMPVADVQSTMKKFAQMSSPARPLQVPVEISQPDDVSDRRDSTGASSARVDLHALRGLSKAECWVLGALLAQPTLYSAIRNDLSLSLFGALGPLATLLLEYFENTADLSECSLAEITSSLEDNELIRQAIELEAMTADWLEPASLSPNHVKMIRQSISDRGLTFEMLAQDSLRELCAARGALGTHNHPDSGMDPPIDIQPPVDTSDAATAQGIESAALEELRLLITARSRAPNLRNTHFPA